MAMSVNTDRRDPTAPRRPFRATVDLSSTDDGDAYQADAIDLSIGGMAVRSELLPALGEQLEFHFTLSDGAPIDALGEVVWASDKGERAGAFGVRFLALPDATEKAIRKHTETDAVAKTKDESRVQLFIEGMDAPLRARVRVRHPGALVLGSDLSFLKLGERVHVDSPRERVEGTIEGVEVEIDAKSRIPRLVLTVDLTGGDTTAAAVKVARVALTGGAVVKTARLPEAREPDPMPAVKPVSAEPPPAKKAPITAAAMDDAESVADVRAEPAHTVVPRRSQVTGVVSDDAGDDEEYEDDAPAPPTWLTGAMEALRGATRKVAEVGGPALRKASGAVSGAAVAGGAFVMAKLGRGSDVVEADGPKSTLRRQHGAAAEAAVADPKAKRRKAVMLVAAALAVGVIIVAVASLGGPNTTTPRPQVGVAPSDPMAVAAAELPSPADPSAPGVMDQGTQPENAVDPSDPNALPSLAPVRAGRRGLPADLAAAAPGASRMAEERPVLANAPVRARRFAAVAPAVAPRAVAPRAAAPAVAAAPARPAVFGNPAVRSGTMLQLRMDGPVTQITGAGARGAAIVIVIPGRHSLDVAAPLVRMDPRLVGAGIFNRSTGAELTLRFREPAPSFSVRAHGSSLEIVLAPTPGAPRARVAVNPEAPSITTHPNGIGVVQHRVAQR